MLFLLLLNYLHNVITRFYCPQTFLYSDFQCRDDVYESNRRFGLKGAQCSSTGRVKSEEQRHLQIPTHCLSKQTVAVFLLANRPFCMQSLYFPYAVGQQEPDFHSHIVCFACKACSAAGPRFSLMHIACYACKACLFHLLQDCRKQIFTHTLPSSLHSKPIFLHSKPEFLICCVVAGTFPSP